MKNYFWELISGESLLKIKERNFWKKILVPLHQLIKMKLLCFYRHKKKGAKQQRDKFSSDKAFCENKEICCVKTHHSFSVYFPLLACQIKKYHICIISNLDPITANPIGSWIPSGSILENFHSSLQKFVVFPVRALSLSPQCCKSLFFEDGTDNCILELRKPRSED